MLKSLHPPIALTQIACCALLFGGTLGAEETDSGYQAIFDGKSLDGWHGQPHFSPTKLAEMSEQDRQAQLAKWDADAAQPSLRGNTTESIPDRIRQVLTDRTMVMRFI